MDTNSITQQIKKYKIQLHELRNALNIAIEREQRIFDAEQHRIVSKTQEFKDDCIATSSMIKQEQMQVMETLAAHTAELDKINSELSELQGHKFKLRHEVLNKIHAENRAKKDVRKNREVFNKQLTDIKAQISSHTTFVNNYETMRRQINEDYYNWKTERDETTAKIAILFEGDRKKDILQKYLDELCNDTRALPENRYYQLDLEITQTRREIEHLGYQYAKLENYMKTFTESAPAQQELAISSYLRDAGARLPVLKNKQRELEKIIIDTHIAINNFDTQMTDLANAPIPTELVEQTARAYQRLEISGQRAHSEYDPLISALTGKILALDNQLAAELEANQLSPQITISRVDTSLQDKQITNTTSAPTNISSAPPALGIDVTGKSRKEIERLKKQQMLHAN
jgi:hypothetical protein